MAKRGRKTVVKSASRKPVARPGLACPAHLTGEASVAWAHIVRLLSEAGTLEITDPTLIEVYAVNVQMLRQAYDSLLKDGVSEYSPHGTRANPACGIINAATVRLKGVISDLGLCPAASKFSAAKTHGAGPADDKWDGLLGVVGG
jgi:P27 family predicted phage terminase small subunit